MYTRYAEPSHGRGPSLGFEGGMTPDSVVSSIVRKALVDTQQNALNQSLFRTIERLSCWHRHRAAGLLPLGAVMNHDR